MVLPILTIIASWVFNIPTGYAVTLTVFASLHLLLRLIKFGYYLND